MFCIARLFYLRKLFINFLPINLNMCFGCSRDRLIATVLLSTHTICLALLAKSHLKWCLIAWRFHSVCCMPRSHIHGSPRRLYYGLNLTDDPGNANFCSPIRMNYICMIKYYYV